MAANDELPPLPSITPQKIKRLIVLLASTNGTPEARDFRTKFEESKKVAHQYAKMRNIHPEFRGSFTPYIMSIEYILHDPRVKKVYATYYPYLSDAARLEDACAALFVDANVMHDLDKGKLFEPEVQQKIETIAAAEKQTPETAKKIEDVIKEALEKKVVEKKKVDYSFKAKPVEVVEKKEANPPKPAVVIPPSTLVLPSKPTNTWRFRAKLAMAKVAPPFRAIGKSVSHQGKMFYTKHPATAKAAIGAAIGGIASTVLGWPGSPITGFIAGVAAPYLAKRAFEVISPPPRPEPDVEEFEYEEPNYAQGAARPGGFSSNFSSGVAQGAARPGGFSPSFNSGIGQGSTRPSRMMGNNFRNLQRAAGAARNIRSAVTVVRGFALLLNPYIGIPVLIIFIILLFFLLFVIFPVDSLFPPGQKDPAGGGNVPQVSIVKSGPTQVANGEKISYSILVTNKGTSAASAEITDTIPEGTEYLDSNPKGTVTGRTVKWSIASIQPSAPQTITLEVQATKNDMWVINEVVGLIKGGPTSSGPVGGSGCPDTSSNRDGFNCKYLNPSIGIFDTAISEEGKEKYVAAYSGRFISAGKGDVTEFRRRVNYIVQQSQEAGLNPGIFLGLWKSENAFGTVGSREFGCAGVGFEEELHCALGIKEFSNPVKNPIANCARSKDANSQACQALKQMRQTFDKDHPVQYPIATFDDFAEVHGPYSHLTGGLPTNCTNSYNILLEVSKEVGMCKPTAPTSPTEPGNPGTPTAPGPIGLSLSCPIEVARISCGTQANPTGGCGHGGQGYGACTAPPYASCPYSPQLIKAIDVIPAKGGNAPVVAPFINGNESVEWTRIQEPLAINGGSWGYKVLYKATYQGKTLVLDLTHINSSVTGSTVKSGEQIGSIYPHTDGNGIGHLHTALSVNGAWVEAVKEAKICGN